MTQLSCLSSLLWLDVSLRHSVSSLASVACCSRLTHLRLAGLNVLDISPLAECTALTNLALWLVFVYMKTPLWT